MKNSKLVAVAVAVIFFISICGFLAQANAAEKFIVVTNTVTNSMMDYDVRVDIDKEVVAKIAAIRGVSSAHGNTRYCISVFKGGAFTWDEIKKEVNWILKTHFKGKNMVVLNYSDYSPEELSNRIAKLISD